MTKKITYFALCFDDRQKIGKKDALIDPFGSHFSRNI